MDTRYYKAELHITTLHMFGAFKMLFNHDVGSLFILNIWTQLKSHGMFLIIVLQHVAQSTYL